MRRTRRGARQNKKWKANSGAVPEVILILSASDRKAIKVLSPKKQRERWKRKLHNSHPTDWADWIEAFMTKIGWTKGTFHRLSMEMLGLAAEETENTGLKRGLWLLVSLGRVERSVEAPGDGPEFRLSPELAAC